MYMHFYMASRHKHLFGHLQAFARCGDIEGAFLLADEYIELGHHMNPKLFSALLTGCLEDPHGGLKLAVEVRVGAALVLMCLVTFCSCIF